MSGRGLVRILTLAPLVDGVLAGASLDHFIKQLPARHRIGVGSFSAYSQAADLGSGLPLVRGICGALLTLTSAAVAPLVLDVPQASLRLLQIARILAITHSIATAQAAPLNFSQRAAQCDDVALRDVFARFERRQMFRAALQLAAFALVVCALATPTP